MSDTDNLEQEAINHGREAWGRLKHDQTFEDWLLVGQALEIGRGWARRRANAPSGRGFNEAFSGWLTDNGFAEIDKGTRSRLADIIEHRAEIEAWRQKLSLRERLRKNHPNSVWRGWEADKRKDGLPTAADEKGAAGEPRRKRARASEIDDATARMQQLIDKAELRIGPDPAQLFDLSPDHLDASVENFLAIYGEQDARKFAIALMARTALKPDLTPIEVTLSPAKHLLREDEMLRRKPRRPRTPADWSVFGEPKQKRGRGIKKLDDPTRPRNRGNGRAPKYRWDLPTFVVDGPASRMAALASARTKRYGEKWKTRKLPSGRVEVTRLA
jgi:hypothetical protein